MCLALTVNMVANLICPAKSCHDGLIETLLFMLAVLAGGGRRSGAAQDRHPLSCWWLPGSDGTHPWTAEHPACAGNRAARHIAATDLSAGVSMSWREFRFNLRPITLLAFGCVVFTTCAVAIATHYLLNFELGDRISARRHHRAA